MPISADEARRLRELIVDPVVEAVRQQTQGQTKLLDQKIETVGTKVEELKVKMDTANHRIGKLEYFRQRLIWSSAIIAAVAGVVARLAWDLIVLIWHHP